MVIQVQKDFKVYQVAQERPVALEYLLGENLVWTVQRVIKELWDRREYLVGKDGQDDRQGFQLAMVS